MKQRSHAGALLDMFLSQAWLRRRIVFHLRQYFYADLDIQVPIGDSLVCPVMLQEYWHSFEEIFVKQEYAKAFEFMPLPSRWIDFGCHAGYFSLFVAWLRREREASRDFESYLIDADPRSKSCIERLVKLNDLGRRMKFHHGVIADATGSENFVMGDVMSSAVEGLSDGSGMVLSVPVLMQQQILKEFPPPYDLIKVDLEGSEYTLLQNYSSVIGAGKFLLVEWHSWHSGGGGLDQIVESAQTLGFKVVSHIVPEKTVRFKNGDAQCGTILLKSLS